MKYHFIKSLVIIFSVFFSVLLVSCGAAAPKIAEQAVTTPDYRENRVLFAETPQNNESKDLRILKHPYELPANEDREIKKLNPIGCIIRGVRIPTELKEPRDIAVVLDVVTAGSESVTSLVAFYQRDVPGGQMLNFQDLLVYYDPEWDGVTPPWFRVRVLEVNAERNTRTKHFLDAANKLSGGLAGMVPHPVLPSVKTAIEASNLIFGNKKNTVLIDYQVQFYSPSQIRGSKVKLTPLRKGEWYVIGRAKGETSEFWRNDFSVDEKTLVLQNKSDSRIIDVPYVSLVLMSADASVPKHIMDRSLVFLELLDSSERNNFDALEEAVGSLNSSLSAYKLERRLKKYTSSSDFINLIEKIEQYKADNNTLKTDQIRTLVRLVNELTKESLLSVDTIYDWWHDNSGAAAGGSFIKSEDLDKYPHGVVWDFQ